MSHPPHFRSRRVGPVVWCYGNGMFWLRIFGKGFHIRDTSKEPLRFSERNGYFQFWTFRWLG